MVPLYLPQPPSADAAEVLQEAAKYVDQLYGERLKVSTLALEGSRPRVMVRAAEDARLVVVGRSHQTGPVALMSAQQNLALAGRVECPVIVVPTRWKPSVDENHIAVGIDGTQLSLEAVEFAFRTASDRGADLTVVHSHHLPYRSLATADDATWMERAGLTVSETLAGWDEEYPNVKVTRMPTTRPVVATLARESEQVGMVVVGAHAGPLPIGDPVTRRTIAEMSCPIAIVAHHPTPAEHHRQATIGADR
jgi:nucleotide-binding universal stress UspA family protein